MIQPIKIGPEPERVGRVILQVTGSRNCTDRAIVTHAILTGIAACTPVGATPRTHPVKEMALRHGDAHGLDRLAGAQAEKMGMTVEKYRAKWEAPCVPSCDPGHRRFRSESSSYCPAAGPRRNAFMIELRPPASLVLAFLQGASVGTRDCMRRAEAAGLPLWVFELAA